MRWRRVGVVVVVSLALSGCSLVAKLSNPEPSASTVQTSPVPTASAATLRDLGPDPTSAQYRSLDLCGLIDFEELQAAYTALGGEELSFEPNGPALCTYSNADRDEWVSLRYAPPRGELPDEVRTTDVGLNREDVTPEGVVIYDPAVESVTVVSAPGYIVFLSGGGTYERGRRLTLAAANEVRSALVSDPPQLSLPAASLSARDLCGEAKSFGLATALEVQDQVYPSVDARTCTLGEVGWFSFVANPDASPPGYEPRQIGSQAGQVRMETCEVLVPMGPAPLSAHWSRDGLYAASNLHDEASCRGFIEALGPFVDRLAQETTG